MSLNKAPALLNTNRGGEGELCPCFCVWFRVHFRALDFENLVILEFKKEQVPSCKMYFEYFTFGYYSVDGL